MWYAEVINDLLVHRKQKFLRLHLANNKHAKHIFGEFRNVSIILLAHRLLRKTDWWLTKKGWNTRQQIHFRLTWANIQTLFWSVLAILENICLFCCLKIYWTQSHHSRISWYRKNKCRNENNTKLDAKNSSDFLVLDIQKNRNVCRK